MNVSYSYFDIYFCNDGRQFCSLAETMMVAKVETVIDFIFANYEEEIQA